MTAISLDNKETGIYRASVWKTTESKLTISVKNISELQSAGESEGKSEGEEIEGEEREHGGQHSSCRPPGPVKPLFDPWVSRGGDEAALLEGEPPEFEGASYSLPSR